MIDPDPRNVARLAEVAEKANGQVRAREAFVSSRVGIAELIERGERVEISTALGPLDVVQGSLVKGSDPTLTNGAPRAGR